MKYILSPLFVLTFFTNHLVAQISNTYEILKIKDEYIPVKTYVDDKLVKNDKKKHEFLYVLSYNQKKDTVAFYDLTNKKSSDNISPVLYTLENIKKNQLLRLLIIQDKKIVDSLTIKFSDETNTIFINNKDSYVLNTTYYKELKNQTHNNRNISDLIDLIDDNLGDYPYQLESLKAFLSHKKYSPGRNFKILKAVVYNLNNQTNENIKWNVRYIYDKNNALFKIEKTSLENEIGFKKELLSRSGKKFSYSEYRNVESKFEDNNEITFDIENKIYSAHTNHFQFRLVKEVEAQLSRISYEKLKAKSILLTKSDLTKYLNIKAMKK